ncbi:MAG: ferritin family protein [Deltaproteobacteria bacterium]|nr:MAG: ferritin family protein [Deltaproteobacteria bacterium]
MFSIREIIDMAIQLEKNAETFYRAAVAKMSTPSLEPVLICLANEERDHSQWFEKLRRVAQEAKAGGQGEEISSEALRSLVGDQKFSLAEVDLANIESVKELIELAVEHEKDTIIFYQMLQSFIDDPETTKELDEIIAEEEQHIKVLMKCEIEMVKSEG